MVWRWRGASVGRDGEARRDGKTWEKERATVAEDLGLHTIHISVHTDTTMIRRMTLQGLPSCLQTRGTMRR